VATQDYVLREVSDKDQTAVVEIFNHFVETSFAAYPSEPAGFSFFRNLCMMAEGYPFYVIETSDGEVVGFGLLHRYHSAETLRRTAELTYFILPEHTRRGLGGRLLEIFIGEARKMGIDNLLASISSQNQISLDFHRMHGFSECGRFHRVGQKFGEVFDVVWMQRFL
jgi:L-amino acid N-acyltransferase YncA